MPLYEYQCSNCHNTLEVFHGINEKPSLKCTECGSESLQKIISLIGGIIFKGSGFYATDNNPSRKNPPKTHDPATQSKAKTPDKKAPVSESS